MDLLESRQLDVARQHVAKVKARTRPWRAVIAVVMALIAAIVSTQARRAAAALSVPGPADSFLAHLGITGNRALQYGAAGAFFLLAAFAMIRLANQARDMLQPSVGSAHAGIVRFAILVVGGLATVVITLQLFGLPVTQLVVGGAVTGVIVGIAAQQTLANVFSGIVLLTARPFRVGDQVGIRSGALSGLIEGTVSEVSVTYVRLETAQGPVHLPNSQVLAAAVGPAGAVPAPPGPATAPAAQVSTSPPQTAAPQVPAPPGPGTTPQAQPAARGAADQLTPRQTPPAAAEQPAQHQPARSPAKRDTGRQPS